MDGLYNFLNSVSAFVWGPVMLVLILGTGFYLMIGLRFMPVRQLGYGFATLWRGRQGRGEGDISAFNALMTALAATIGTGNIIGVATAIYLGGPGALFWMWCTALVGMATKYAEAVCAVRYRETDEAGNHVGGPMYYIKNGLGTNWLWLGSLFAIFGAIAGFGIGNMVQANSVADALQSLFQVSTEQQLSVTQQWLFKGVIGLLLAGFVWLVLIGGIRRIAEVAGKLVPTMAILYILGGLTVLVLNATEIPTAFQLIFTQAFTGTAATGGFAGVAVLAAIRYGIARGIFSNEAGLGSAAIAHAAAKTNNPVQQGIIAMLGTFIDTLIVCTITGLVIITSGAWTSGETGAPLSAMAFEQSLAYGHYLVTFGLIFFAFTTLLGWSFYGEKCVQYLFGFKAVTVFRWLWVFAIPIGAIAELKFVWIIADILNALMAIPNLIALLLLSPVIFKLTRQYFSNAP